MELLFWNPLVNGRKLRAHARTQVESSPLIQKCREGDKVAVEALMVSFWPFVEGFEKAIDKYPFISVAKLLLYHFGVREVKAYLTSIRSSLATMVREEGQHASLWKEDTYKGLGIELVNERPLFNIERLLNGASRDTEPLSFFCHLAGTEYIAEELSRSLCGSERFTAFFPNNTWRWGEVHLMVHEDEPSHLQIDEDLARACGVATWMHNSDIYEKMTACIMRSEELFFEASVEALENTPLPFVTAVA